MSFCLHEINLAPLPTYRMWGTQLLCSLCCLFSYGMHNCHQYVICSDITVDASGYRYIVEIPFTTQ